MNTALSAMLNYIIRNHMHVIIEQVFIVVFCS